jgi:hypothetical protein
LLSSFLKKRSEGNFIIKEELLEPKEPVAPGQQKGVS